MPCICYTLAPEVVTRTVRSTKVVRFDFQGPRNAHACVRYVYVKGYNFERHAYTSKNRSLKFTKWSQCDHFGHIYLTANRNQCSLLVLLSYRVCWLLCVAPLGTTANSLSCLILNPYPMHIHISHRFNYDTRRVNASVEIAFVDC